MGQTSLLDVYDKGNRNNKRLHPRKSLNTQ